jgi:heme exporter protein A
LDSTLISGTADPLVLTGIGRRFQHRWALRGVSLRLARGDVLALMGRNGSGKSTLLRIAATLLKPSRGTGSIFGADLVRDPASARGMVALLGHENGLYEDLTAAENLGFAVRMLGARPDQGLIKSALSEVGLADVSDERVRNFSSGMQRRLAIARVRLQAPALLLLDEPYNSMDTDGILLINGLLAKLRARGGAALVVVHDVERVGGVATRWARLRDGLVVDCPDPAGAAADSPAIEEVA